MGAKSGSGFLRLLTAFLLASAAVPILLTWYMTDRHNAAPSKPLDASATAAWEVPGEIEVQFKPGVGNDALSDLSQKIGAPLAWDGPLGAQEEIADVAMPSGTDAAKTLATLQSDSRVEAADVEHIYRTPESLADESHPTAIQETTPDSGHWKPNDPRYSEQWNFRMVKAEEAWEVTHGKGVVVAVIDTGVAYANTKKGNQARDFGNTHFVPGYDFCSRDNMPNDDNGHGTHVAGTIAESTDNNEGVAGLAFEASIMPLKVLTGEGRGYSADIAEAIRWAADHGANVINMSLGGPLPDKLCRSACEYAHKKGVAIICAAGNSGREGVGYPAAYPDCIAVSSVGPKGDLSFYSTWGKQVAVAAPGGDKMVDPEHGGILQNTVLRDDTGAFQDDYFAFQGTSMASPHVAAIAALIESQGVKDPEDVRCILQKSAQHVNGPKEKYGAGIVDAAGAVKLAGAIHGDDMARFWIVAALFAGCYAIGRMRRKAGSTQGAPFWTTAAFSFGLLFPDWLTGFIGISAHANLIGHSVLVPGAMLLGLGTEDKKERNLVGWMALGLLLHLGWEFMRGTAPFGTEIGFWQLLPWVLVNGIVGLGIWFSGLAPTKD